MTLAPFLGTAWNGLWYIDHLYRIEGADWWRLQPDYFRRSVTCTFYHRIGTDRRHSALIGYNYLKNLVYDFDAEMGRFATDVLSAVELQYRKMDVVA